MLYDTGCLHGELVSVQVDAAWLKRQRTARARIHLGLNRVAEQAASDIAGPAELDQHGYERAHTLLPQDPLGSTSNRPPSILDFGPSRKTSAWLAKRKPKNAAS